MGDFNYSDINWSSPHIPPTMEASRLFVECSDDCFLTKHVKEPTGSTPSNKTTLDQVITDQPEMADDVEMLDNLENSDHHMVRWTTLAILCPVEYQGKAKDYNKGNFVAIRNQIAQVD